MSKRINITKTAQAMIYLEQLASDMGDCFEEYVTNICYWAGTDFNAYNVEEYYGKKEYADCHSDKEIMDKALLKAYKTSIKYAPQDINRVIEYWDEADYFDYYFLPDLENENSEAYQSIKVLYIYAMEKNLPCVDILKSYLTKIKEADIDASRISALVGNEYHKYLSNHFGRQCGSPEIFLASLFRTTPTDIIINIRVGRMGYINEKSTCADIAGYIYDFGEIQFSKDTQIQDIAKTLAKKYNELLPKLYDMADNYQSLYKILEYNKPLETITHIEHITDSRMLLNAAISRWTTCRGKNLEAEIEKEEWNSDNDFTVSYKNDLSDNFSGYTPLVEYKNNIFTVKVVKNGKTICCERNEMHGALHENSPLVSKTITECWIAANFAVH